jgi:hypothetical protein
MGDKSRLVWKSGDKLIRKAPARSFWQRFQSGFFGIDIMKTDEMELTGQ